MSGTTAVVLADSVASNGSRLTTLDLTFPMFVQPQLLRHRAFSFSVQSTRAVPLAEQIRRVRENPCMPVRWGAAQKGMVAAHEVSECSADAAREQWERAAVEAADSAGYLLSLGIHQEVAARLLAPFQWCRALVTATEWDNFFALRIDTHAQAEIRVLAEAIREARDASETRPLALGEWHLPLVADDERTELSEQFARIISAGRCARVSYLQHDGRRDASRDYELGCRLTRDGHWSALEHQATPARRADDRHGNFRGWFQHRGGYAHEDNRAAFLAAEQAERGPS